MYVCIADSTNKQQYKRKVTTYKNCFQESTCFEGYLLAIIYCEYS